LVTIVFGERDPSYYKGIHVPLSLQKTSILLRQFSWT